MILLGPKHKQSCVQTWLLALIKPVLVALQMMFSTKIRSYQVYRGFVQKPRYTLRDMGGDVT